MLQEDTVAFKSFLGWEHRASRVISKQRICQTNNHLGYWSTNLTWFCNMAFHEGWKTERDVGRTNWREEHWTIHSDTTNFLQCFFYWCWHERDLGSKTHAASCIKRWMKKRCKLSWKKQGINLMRVDMWAMSKALPNVKVYVCDAQNRVWIPRSKYITELEIAGF